MANLNQALCAINLRNTGTGTCVINPKMIAGAIRVPDGVVITQSQLNTLQAFLAAGILADSKTLRYYPIADFRTPTDASEALVTQSMGDGSKVPVRDGNYNWTFQYIDGGLCLSNALQSFNFQKSSWLFFDIENLLFGWRKLDATGLAYGLAGVPVTFHANPFKMATGAEIAAYTVMFDFKPQYINKYFGYVQADFELSSLKGLQNLVLRQTGASAAGVFKIRLLSGCDENNTYDLISTLVNASLFKLTNKLTGNAITITSVVADPNAKAYTITAASADPDYPGAAEYITVDMVGPTELDTADISGFEAIPVDVLRGA